jgi:hypothetical protein
VRGIALIIGSVLVAALLAGCGGVGDKAARAGPSSAGGGCPQAWRAGWQALADRIRAPVYCPSWLPNPLDARIGGPWSAGRFVERDHSYLVPFIWQESLGTGVQEVHVNFRGYPGRSAIPICPDTVVVGGKIRHPRRPCFDDARGHKRFGDKLVTVYTANQGADQWHVLYAWHHGGSLYAVSEHVAVPYTYARVIANLDRMLRGLVLLRPA